MKTNIFTDVFKNVKHVASKHSPELLTGLGIAGMLTSTVLAVKATPKAMHLLDEKKSAKSGDDKLTVKETVKTTYKCYIPTACVAAMSIACLVGASKVNLKRNAVLATAYKLAESTHKEYRKKVIETIGEKKEEAIKDKIAKDKIDKSPVGSREVIITNRGNTLCYDALSDRYFRTDIDRIKKVENELNRRMIYDMYISLNEFYTEIGLKPTKLGDELGWNLDNGLITLDYSSQLTDYDEPCLVIDFSIAPRYDYSKIYR